MPPGLDHARWLWRDYLSRSRNLLILAGICMAIEGATLGLFARSVQPLFDRVLVSGERGAIYGVGFVVLGIFALRALTSAAQRVLLTRVVETTAARLRGDLLAHVMSLDGAFHQANPPGSLIERVQGDVAAINKVWSAIVLGLGRDVVSVIALFGVALWVDWRLTLVALVGAPLLVLPSLIAQTYVRTRARLAREAAARMATRLDEIFHGIAAVKLNGLERRQSGVYDRLSRDKVDAEIRTAAGQATVPALIDLMAGVGFFGVLVYGGGQIANGDKTVGEFMSFFTALALAFDPLRRLGNLSGLWQAARASIERLRGLLAERPTILDPAAPVRPPRGAPEIAFEDVHLAYGDMPALDGASFIAEAGRTTALVGLSGAGKSTVFNLLTRLVDPQSGRVTVGGTDHRDLALADLRGLISVVAQDALLFDESLRDNILLGQTGISAARLDEVVEAAHIAEFLPRLPGGLDSPAGPRGSNLSGGQRQRVAIARALLRDTPILLLDEATSALDTRSEALVQAALDRLAAGRTTLVIAHRLSTVRDAHRIVVMESGRIVDTGTHAELIARGGLYAELARMQFDKAG